MKFAHIGDCHLGGWRQRELQDLNLKYFKLAIEIIIKEKVDFLLVTGDLFDSPYPPIDTLKEAFAEFKKLSDSKIPVFIIAGSHDYSVSGKTFLEVLEKAGLCINASKAEERNGKIMLHPLICKGAAIYGYPGKKSSLEVDDVERLTLQDAPGLFKILMLHTALQDAAPNLPAKMVNQSLLPKVDYVALSHLHIKYQKENRVYSGPIFPNNLSELVDLKGGSFFIFENGQAHRILIQPHNIEVLDLELSDSSIATDSILSALENRQVENSIVVIRLKGILSVGKSADIDFQRIESVLRQRGALVTIRSTTNLLFAEPEVHIDLSDAEEYESSIIKSFTEKNPSTFNQFIEPLMRTLQSEQPEDETSAVFNDRLLSECRRILSLEDEA